MARTFNEIVFDHLDFYRNAQPNLDTKPGSVSRDLLIDGPATQLARLYQELNKVSNSQSLRQSIGSDVDKYGGNFGAKREIGSKASGIALLTFNTLDSDISVKKGDTVSAKNGSTFLISNSFVISKALASNYQAIASRYRADLDFLGINDKYAVTALVEASAIGTSYNISKYGLNSSNISGIDNVTNVTAFGNGKSTQSDAAYKNSILSIFSGANTGTSTGYSTVIKSDASILDAIVVEPGDDLMTRDGTQVSIAEDGTRTIVSEGTGGKVDIYVFGSRLQQSSDSFIYKDKSNLNDPTNTKNDFILGQIKEDENKTITKKRRDNLKSKTLPAQPINNIVSVSGSLSGPNFIEKSVDDLGRISGNYELIFDTGDYGGSPWGSDYLHWINNKIENFQEDKTKSSFNSQDTLSFTDVEEIKKIQQNILITDDNPKVNASDRSILQLSHYPVTSVTRVFNVTTGERYVVTNQNTDNGGINTTGKIVISGKSLPATSDILQADYIWLFDYDKYFDYDNKLGDNIRTVGDSVDWGFSNFIRREEATLTTSGDFLIATVSHNISSIASVNIFSSETSTVTLVSDRKAVIVADSVENVVSIKSNDVEYYQTSVDDGTFSSFTIFLPTDTLAEVGDSVDVIYNAIDVYNADTQGNFNNNVITIYPSTDAVAGSIVECNYIANTSTLLPTTTLSSLPAIRAGNGFSTNAVANVGSQPTTHIFNGDNISSNLRLAPSVAVLNIRGNISSGTLNISGITSNIVMDYVFIATANGLKQDLSAAIRKFLGLSSKDSIGSNYKIIKLDKIEKVEANTSFEVLDSLYTYSIKNYKLKDNSFAKNEAIADSSLKSTEIELPSNTYNEDNTISIGDYIRVTFHLANTSGSENVFFSKAGTQYTNNKFLLIDTISIASGFISTASRSAQLTITNLNQPITKSRYKVYYDYLAPKQNERITITYNYDKIVSDAQLNIEKNRPINADVLVKRSSPVLVDITMKIVVSTDFTNSSTLVKQNVQDAITSALQSKALNTIIDDSDLINVAYSVTGVDRARITFFNKANSTGSVRSIKANLNEYIYPNTVNIEIESR